MCWYRWIMCLSAGEKLVALSDLSRQRGTEAMCEQAFRKHWCGGEAADSGDSQCAAPVLSICWPSQVSIQYREHVSILAHSQKLSCQIWRNILFWGKKRNETKPTHFRCRVAQRLMTNPGKMDTTAVYSSSTSSYLLLFLLCPAHSKTELQLFAHPRAIVSYSMLAQFWRWEGAPKSSGSHVYQSMAGLPVSVRA